MLFRSASTHGQVKMPYVWLAAVHVDASRYAVVGATNNKLKLTYPATSIRSRLVRTELLEAGIRHLILIAKEARQELQ